MDGKHTDSASPSRVVRYWRRAVPLGVAAAVAAGIGGGVDLVHRFQEDDDKPAKASAKQASGQQDTSGPRYVVGVRRTGTALVVREVKTGKDVGPPVAAPQGQRFRHIAAGGEGTYVVSAVTDRRKVVFNRLRLDSDGTPKDLAAIPNVTVDGAATAWSDLAVDRNGDRLASVTYRGQTGRVDVVSLATGERRSWTTRLPGRITNLSWAGSTLSFVWNPIRTVNGRPTVVSHQLRRLDTAGPVGDLRVSKAVMKLPKGSVSAILSHDGRTVVVGVGQGSELTLQTYSSATGQPAQVLWKRQQDATPARISPDATGRHLLAVGDDGRLYARGGAVPAQDLSDAAW
ncbi:hypothetical protein [Actinomadura kijaniata]|uniref:hypothetical protein n=1 Tax=Actinomadura kijaniata TaxID=46161 RepID=UPI00082CDCFD|nr:hypothetical protein [Actinomadura kijaniata]